MTIWQRRGACACCWGVCPAMSIRTFNPFRAGGEKLRKVRNTLCLYTGTNTHTASYIMYSENVSFYDIYTTLLQVDSDQKGCPG